MINFNIHKKIEFKLAELSLSVQDTRPEIVIQKFQNFSENHKMSKILVVSAEANHKKNLVKC